MTAEQIIEELKAGKYYSIACSNYEEYYWYRDGKFHSSMENGIHDPKDTMMSEDRVRGEFARALMNKERYDVWEGI